MDSKSFDLHTFIRQLDTRVDLRFPFSVVSPRLKEIETLR